jgi:ribonuclease HI
MGEELVSNNHMELLAVITALRILKTMCDPAADSVYLYTDSMYVQQGITMWINAWKKRNWKTSAGTPVVNKELWEELEKLKNEYYNLHFAWVRGHNGNIHNEHIDQFIKSE